MKQYNTCSQHKKEVAGISDMKVLAEAIVNLHYESHAELYKYLTDAYAEAADKDLSIDKTDLAKILFEISYRYFKMQPLTNRLWQISKPFMETKNNSDETA